MISTCLLDRTFPRPLQVVHCPLRGTELPTPAQTWHVLAIWNPLSMTYVRVPEPPQAVHVVRFAPAFKPLPEQVPQSVTGLMLTFFVVPLQASINEIFIVCSRFAPRSISMPREAPPPKAPNSCSKRSDPEAWPNPALKPWKPEKPLAPLAPAKALGSKPGC